MMRPQFWKVLVIAAILPLGCVARSNTNGERSSTDVAALLSAAHVDIASIVQERGTGSLVGMSRGSGGVIGRMDDRVLIVTAKHVIRDRIRPADATVQEHRLFVMFEQRGELMRARVEASSDRGDIAVISCEPPTGIDIRPLPLATRLPERGDIAYIVGSPGHARGLISHGLVAGICGETMSCSACVDEGCYILDRPLYPGNSGGVIANTDGELIGVAVQVSFFRFRGLTVDPYLSIFVGIELLEPLLAEIDDDQPLSHTGPER